jgi:hypothetical protein
VGQREGGEIVATLHEEPQRRGWSRKTWLLLIGAGIAVAVVVVLLVMLTGGGSGGRY